MWIALILVVSSVVVLVCTASWNNPPPPPLPHPTPAMSCTLYVYYFPLMSHIDDTYLSF